MDGGVSRAIPLTDEEDYFAESGIHAAIPEELLNLDQLDVLYEDRTSTLWTFMNPEGRPSFNASDVAGFRKLAEPDCERLWY